MVVGEKFFDKANQSDPIYKLVLSGNFKAFWEKVFSITNRTLSNDLKNLLEGMICSDPSKRLEVKDIIAHKWLNSHVATEESVLKLMSLNRPKQ